MTLEAALSYAEDRCRAARSIEALAFTIANETRQLLVYRQALVWRSGLGAPDLLAISGLSVPAEDSPFTVWVKRLAGAMWPRLGDAPASLHLAALEAATSGAPSLEAGLAEALPSDRIHGWKEWWPPHLVTIPMSRDGETYGAVFLLFENATGESELALLSRLQATWSYCAWALTRARPGSRAWRLQTKAIRWIAFGAVGALLAMPIHQSALAPAEIVALKAIAIAAPIDGVIDTIHLQPNQMAKTGQPLFSLDDTTLRNRREVAARALDVAFAELLAAQQKAFDDRKARGEVATLKSRIEERRAELRAVKEQLVRIEVSAPRDGIAVFGDVNDWQGRPVVTGERVMQLADPKDAGILVFLPAADAIALEEGARIRVFLHVAPLSPIEGTLRETSYQAVLAPDGVASYRLRGSIEAADEGVVRIGLKGIAKVYGATVPLIYYLLRRPLATLRQWSGI